jgi:FkbM family methyltransferase
MIRHFYKKLGGALGLKVIAKGEARELDETLIERIMGQLLDAKGHLGIAQIGANNGKWGDPIFDFVLRNRDRTSILLVEPQADVVVHLRENYRDHPNAFICNCAVGSGGPLKLFRVSPAFRSSLEARKKPRGVPEDIFLTDVTSFSREHVVANAGRFGVPESAVEEITVPSVNLRGLLESVDWGRRRIDVLQVDTEGMDDVVIYECDIKELQPTLINFEGNLWNSERRGRLDAFLVSCGYAVIDYSQKDSLALALRQS